MALILISHDLGVIAESVSKMLVMYGGSVVESGPTAAVFAERAHPYTQGLFAARPALGAPRGLKLATIRGSVPELVDLPPGCPFAGRCRYTVEACEATRPPAVALPHDHRVRCIRLDEIAAEGAIA
jgi:peptide/nickel transport system ATP-binding protein